MFVVNPITPRMLMFEAYPLLSTFKEKNQKGQCTDKEGNLQYLHVLDGIIYKRGEGSNIVM